MMLRLLLLLFCVLCMLLDHLLQLLQLLPHTCILLRGRGGGGGGGGDSGQGRIHYASSYPNCADTATTTVTAVPVVVLRCDGDVG